MKVASIVYLFILATLFFLLANFSFYLEDNSSFLFIFRKEFKRIFIFRVIVIGFSGLHLALTFFTNSLNVVFLIRVFILHGLKIMQMLIELI